MKPIYERIDTRPKEDPIPQTDRNGIDGGDGGDGGGGGDKEKLIKEKQKELIEILEPEKE